MQKKAIRITEETFEDTIRSGVVLVDFFAEWCGPCGLLSPVIDKIADKFHGRAVVAKLEAEESPQPFLAHNIRTLPTLLFFKDGEVADSLIGMQSNKKISDILEGLLT